MSFHERLPSGVATCCEADGLHYLMLSGTAGRYLATENVCLSEGCDVTEVLVDCYDVQRPAHGCSRRKHGRWPRRVRRWAAAVVLLGLLTSLYYWRDDLTRWGELVVLRHRALNYRDLPDRALVTQMSSDDVESWGKALDSRCTRPGKLADDVQLKLLSKRAADRVYALPFLHERTSPSGNRCLVSVAFHPSWGHTGLRLTLIIELFEPGSLRNPTFREVTVANSPQLIETGRNVNVIGAARGGIECEVGIVAWGADFRLFPGYADPTNRAQFIIPYVVNNNHGTFIGKLGDDDSVYLRHGEGNTLPIQLPEAPNR